MPKKKKVNRKRKGRFSEDKRPLYFGSRDVTLFITVLSDIICGSAMKIPQSRKLVTSGKAGGLFMGSAQCGL
jgi:hypothetical protein